MADFCRNCSLNMFDKDFQELADISTEADTESGIYAVVLCESCGPIQVDHRGVCVTSDCRTCRPTVLG